MKRMLAALTLALLMAFSALAASLPQDTGQSGKSEIPSMILALNLKESQKKKLEPVYAERNRQLKSIAEDKSMTDEARRARIGVVNQNINETLKQVLTHDQKKKLTELRKKGGQ
ncbi:MAG: hypothetical protein U0Z53_03955 [Blastocatellia bacterium]